ncbi:MAG: MMPL family transporter [Planctomycetes bacterium]|nr:MMPL family transporter [Planctomycetota bacterium]
MKAGSTIIRFRWPVLILWIILACALMFLAPVPDPARTERVSFLPPDCPSRIALEAMQQCFTGSSGNSEAAVIFERIDGKLTPADRAKIEEVAQAIGRPDQKASAGDLAGTNVRSPASVEIKLPFTGRELVANPMVSKSGQAAIVMVSTPFTFITNRSARVVEHIRNVLDRSSLPAGLKAAISGSAGFGYDYANATKHSHDRTLWVTVLAVVVILLLVYRAPLAAAVPLAAISMAAIVVMKLLDLLQGFGMHTGTAERIFVIVLLYGSGTDYSLLLVSRCREFLDAGEPASSAAGKAFDFTLPAIMTAAGTNVAGLFMIYFAKFGIFSTTGLAVAMALVLAFLAAVMIVPAGLAILGPAVFWPGRRRSIIIPRDGTDIGIGGRNFWRGMAKAVTARPGLILIVTVAALALPAWRGANQVFVYDALADVKPTYVGGIGNAAAGIEIVSRHWPVGELSPVNILVRRPPVAGAAQPSARDWQELSARLTESLLGCDAVEDVRSLTSPLGKGLTGAGKLAVMTLGDAKVAQTYLSPKLDGMRLYAMLKWKPLTNRSLAAVGQIRDTVHKTLAGRPDMEVHITGASAEMIDIKNVTHRDFQLVVVLTLTAVLGVILVLFRRPVLCAVMVASTVLGYLATLGITYWCFISLGGAGGLDWKVEVFVFVALVAVGVDYNIFLVARLIQESKENGTDEAIRRALVRTGPVISSCGLIMAATLGSLAAGELPLLKQLGAAFAVGMLIDTFIIRPLILPAFASLLGKRSANVAGQLSIERETRSVKREAMEKFIWSEIESVWQSCIADRSKDSNMGVPPDSLHIEERSEGIIEQAECIGKVIRAFIMDDSGRRELQKPFPKYETGERRDGYWQRGYCAYFIDANGETGIFMFQIGPRCGRGCVLKYDEVLCANPISKKLAWVS